MSKRINNKLHSILMFPQNVMKLENNWAGEGMGPKITFVLRPIVLVHFCFLTLLTQAFIFNFKYPSTLQDYLRSRGMHFCCGRFNIKRDQWKYINLGAPRILRVYKVVGEGRFRSKLGGKWEIQTPYRGPQNLKCIRVIFNIISPDQTINKVTLQYTKFTNNCTKL